MDSIYYLGPLREYPRREYHWGGSSPEDVGQRGERTVDAILAATRDGETRSLGYRRRRKSFQEMIAYWLNAVTPIDDERRGFEEPPENTFDRSDRKFLAVAVSAGAVVLNATDSDWGEEQELMDGLWG